MDLVLHIGRDKTGTTAIQWHLAETPPSGVTYPRSGRVEDDGRVHPGHHVLARTLVAPEPKGSEDLVAIVDGIRTEAEDDDVVILSSEAFQHLDEDGLRRLSSLIDRLAPRSVRIVCYLRDFLGYAMSAFQQEVQSGTHVHNFVEYASSVALTDPEVLLRRWSAVGDLIVRPYARELLRGGDSATDFLASLVLPTADVVTQRDRNPSIGGNLLFVKAALNRFGTRRPPPYDLLARIAASEPRFRGPFRIDPELVERLEPIGPYAASFNARFPDVRPPSFALAPAVPDLERLDRDLAVLRTALGPYGDDVPLDAARALEATAWFGGGPR